MFFKVHKKKHLSLKKQHTCSVWAPEWDRLNFHLQSVSYLDSRNKANINKMSALTYKSQGILNIHGRSTRSDFLKVSPSSVPGVADGVIVSTLERQIPATQGSPNPGSVSAPRLTPRLFPSMTKYSCLLIPKPQLFEFFKLNVTFYKLFLAFLVTINVML